MRAMEEAAQRGWETIMVFDDDFSFIRRASVTGDAATEFAGRTVQEVWAVLAALFRLWQRQTPEVRWDGVMLAGNFGHASATPLPWLLRTQGVRAASGYLVRGLGVPGAPQAEAGMIRLLRESFASSYERLGMLPTPAQFRAKCPRGEDLGAACQKVLRARDAAAPDVIWGHLHKLRRWFMAWPKLGKQRPGYSDISGRWMNHTMEMRYTWNE
jgi:hypothetical protein